MKRKFLLVVLLILVALICFFLFAPVTFGIKKQLVIAAPIINVSGQVTDLRNWHHWNTLLKNKDSAQFKISDITNQTNSWLRVDSVEYLVLHYSPASITIKESERDKKIYHSIFLFPDSNIANTKVIWIENLSPLAWLKEKIKSSGIVEKNLSNLKNYFEDPVEYYGFDIRTRKIVDTLEVTEIVTTSNANRLHELGRIYNKIVAYSNRNNLGITDSTPRMANFHEMLNDSVRIMAAIPVSKKAAVENNLTYFEMPREGRMIFARYEGDYPGLQKLYKSMDRFMADKNLKPSAAGYERFLNNPKNAQDSLHMKIELCYPIF
jgi:effector-binding domain-containing protein